MENKEHLTTKGLEKLVSIRAALGLTEPSVISFLKLGSWDINIKDPNWSAG